VIKHISIVAWSLGAFAAPSSAFAAGPSASVSATTSAFSAAGSTIVRFGDDGPDPAASIDLYAPPEYGVDLSQPLGATIGNITGQATLTAGGTVRVGGLVKMADPAAYVAAAATCTPGRTVHDAVWTIGINSGGTAFGPLTAFVDRGAAGQAFSVHVRACLGDPAATGLRLSRAVLTLNGVFANPPTAGEYRWTAILRTLSTTPTLPFESQTIVRLPPRLTLTAKPIRPHGRRGRTFVRVSGAVTENGFGVSGVRVEVLAGPRAPTLTRLAYATSFARGRFAVVAPLRAKTVFRARISAPLRAGPLSRCETFSIQPDAICSSLTLAPFTAQSRSRTVTRR
jgi:hypothetical protein